MALSAFRKECLEHLGKEPSNDAGSAAMLATLKLEEFMAQVTPATYPNRLCFDLTPSMIDGLADELMARSNQALDAVAAVPAGAHTFANTIQVLADEMTASGPLQSSVDFLQNVSGSAEVRDASRKADTLLSQFDVDAGMRADVYESVLAFAETEEAKLLRGEQKRLLERHLRSFRRRGLGLPPKERERVGDIQKEMSALGIEFQSNLGEEVTTLLFAEEELAGVPQDKLESLEIDKTSGKRIVTLKTPDYMPIMRMCEVEETRRQLEMAYNRRCIDRNTQIMERLIVLRSEQAKILGFGDHRAFRLDITMAKTSQRVSTFLWELAEKLAGANQHELGLLRQLKKAERERQGLPVQEGDLEIKAWDLKYYCRLREELEFDVDTNAIKEYFPLEVTTAGLLDIYASLLGLTFRRMDPEEVHVWHPDVTMFEVTDAATKEFVGHFYLDLFSRPGKYGHAACFNLQPSCGQPQANIRIVGGNPRSRQHGASAIVANFSSPTDGRPSLLEHDDVVTFFHEFGHLMHQLCSTATYSTFSGTAVERDFVEAPSQMLENWCWEKEALQRMSGHFSDPSRKLPDDVISKLVASKDANGALLTIRQIVFALFDQEIHSCDSADTAAVYARLLWQVAGIRAAPGTNFAAGFNHVGGGGYSAQYYGYLWSEVFSCDMFRLFKSRGVFSTELGQHYRRTILEPGGSLDASDMLRNFLGREPSTEPFLASKGVGGGGRRRLRLLATTLLAAAGIAVVAVYATCRRGGQIRR